jgi:hypothetical protein
MDLDLHPNLLEIEDHLRPQILEVVHGRHREVSLLVPWLVAEVESLPLFARLPYAAGAPDALDRIDVVVALVLVLVEPGRVEDVELQLGAPVRDVGDPGLPQIKLGLSGDVARISRVHLSRDWIPNEAMDDKSGVLEEGIDVGGVRIGEQEHVGFLDLLEPSDGRAVEAVAGLERLLGQLADRNGEMLHQPGEIAEPQVDDLGGRLLRHHQHVLGCRHPDAPFVQVGRRVARRRCPVVSSA